MAKKRTFSRIIIAVLMAVFIPLSFFVIGKWINADKVQLPEFYLVDRVDTLVSGNGEKIFDTVYHQVADLVLENQLGKQISLNTDLSGKILLVDFIFINCPSVCPKLTRHMAMLQHAFRKDPKKEYVLANMIQFVSITVNPLRDSVEALRDYADEYGADHDRWWFLTGAKKDIYDFARHELGVVVQPGDGGPEDFIHTQKFVLIDQQRYVRGYYDGLDTADLRRCADDIVLLTMEKKKNP